MESSISTPCKAVIWQPEIMPSDVPFILTAVPLEIVPEMVLRRILFFAPKISTPCGESIRQSLMELFSPVDFDGRRDAGYGAAHELIVLGGEADCSIFSTGLYGDVGYIAAGRSYS